MASVIKSFDDYLEGIQSEQSDHSLSEQLTLKEEIQKLNTKDQANYLVDYSFNNYPFVSNTLQIFSGCDSEELMTKGLDYTRKAWHPDDWKTHSLYIFPTIIEFLDSEPKHKRDRFEFIFNYRVKNPNSYGEYEYNHITQKSHYLNFFKDGLPYLSSGFIDHSNLPSSSNTMYLRILYNNETVYQQSFISLDKTLDDLTTAERNVLQLWADGFSYEEIKVRLNISPNTVSNHMKHIKEKLGRSAAEELKTLAKQSGLI